MHRNRDAFCTCQRCVVVVVLRYYCTNVRCIKGGVPSSMIASGDVTALSAPRARAERLTSTYNPSVCVVDEFCAHNSNTFLLQEILLIHTKYTHAPPNRALGSRHRGLSRVKLPAVPYSSSCPAYPVSDAPALIRSPIISPCIHREQPQDNARIYWNRIAASVQIRAGWNSRDDTNVQQQWRGQQWQLRSQPQQQQQQQPQTPRQYRTHRTFTASPFQDGHHRLARLVGVHHQRALLVQGIQR